MTYTLGDELRVVGCNGQDHPQACTARLQYADGRDAYGDEMPYSWTLHRERAGPRAGSSYHQLSDAEQALLGDFLEAHGIAPARFLNGNNISVRVRCDGVLMVHAWRAVDGADDGFSSCPCCPECARQERVVTPLVTPVPDVTGAFVARRVRSMPRQHAAPRQIPRLVFQPPPMTHADFAGRFRQVVDVYERTRRQRH